MMEITLSSRLRINEGISIVDHVQEEVTHIHVLQKQMTMYYIAYITLYCPKIDL